MPTTLTHFAPHASQPNAAPDFSLWREGSDTLLAQYWTFPEAKLTEMHLLGRLTPDEIVQLLQQLSSRNTHYPTVDNIIQVCPDPAAYLETLLTFIAEGPRLSAYIPPNPYRLSYHVFDAQDVDPLTYKALLHQVNKFGINLIIQPSRRVALEQLLLTAD